MPLVHLTHKSEMERHPKKPVRVNPSNKFWKKQRNEQRRSQKGIAWRYIFCCENMRIRTFCWMIYTCEHPTHITQASLSLFSLSYSFVRLSLSCDHISSWLPCLAPAKADVFLSVCCPSSAVPPLQFNVFFQRRSVSDNLSKITKDLIHPMIDGSESEVSTSLPSQPGSASSHSPVSSLNHLASQEYVYTVTLSHRSLTLSLSLTLKHTQARRVCDREQTRR